MTYSFGTFAFDAASLELTREGRPVRLEPQPARALAMLLARAGEVVTRDELRAAIWGEHTHVDYDRGLAYCLAQVRTALGDNAENPRFVQTLPKRGFRFLAPVTRSGEGSGRAPASGPPPVPPPDAPAEGTAVARPGSVAADLAHRGGGADGPGAHLGACRHAAPPDDRGGVDLRQRNRRPEPRRLRDRSVGPGRGPAHRAGPRPGRCRRQRRRPPPAARHPQPEVAGRRRSTPTTS